MGQYKYWTYNRCKSAALKCKGRWEFQNKYNKAYHKAAYNNWLNEICSHMEGRKIWTFDKVFDEALKYKSRSEFIKKSSGAYQRAHNNNWLGKVCGHMIPIGNLYKRCIYAYEFPDNHVYVGLAYNINKRHNRHMSIAGPVKNHINKTGLTPILKQLTKYLPVETAQNKEGYWQRKYKREGWISLHKSAPGAIGGCTLKWTKEACAKEALKYNYRSDFIKNSASAYSSALNRGWLNDICFHMISAKNKCRSIPIISIKGDEKLFFSSFTEAANKLGLVRSCIGRVVNGKLPHTGGYKFEYYNKL